MLETVNMAMKLLDEAAEQGIFGIVISFGATMTISDVERYREYIENNGYYCSYRRQSDQTSFDIWI